MHKSRNTDKRPEEGLMVWVLNDNIETAIRRLRRKLDTAGLMDELRARRYHTKRSVKKREKQREAEFKRKK